MDEVQSMPCRILTISLLFAFVSTVSPMGSVKPMPTNYAITKLTQRQQQQFVDEHNRFRSLVRPSAANMEYVFWNNDLANLAQMWANKCVYDHGFLEFGEAYPNSPFSGQVGQSLARAWGHLYNPADRVRYWYQQSQHYMFSMFATSMVTNRCSKLPCKRYTQLVWAKTKFLGCGIAFCDETFGNPHARIRGETEVVCDYAPTGSVRNQFPYEVGKPCSKCASGKGFCYKNLCRDCDDFDSECGKSLTPSMCTAFKDFMAKKCPKMCSLCECPLQCLNGGTLNSLSCTCRCPPGWGSLDCSDTVPACPDGFYGESCQSRCVDRVGKDVCHWRLSNGHQCSASYMKVDCAATCGVCGSPTVKPIFVATTPVPRTTRTTPFTVMPATPPRGTPLGAFNVTTVKLPSVPVARLSDATALIPPNTSSTTGINLSVMVPNVTELHQPPSVFSSTTVNALRVTPSERVYLALPAAKDRESLVNRTAKSPPATFGFNFIRCNDSDSKCPFWASAGECARDRAWMQSNCRKSCNQCGLCKDSYSNCAELALKDKCIAGNQRRWMLTNCRKSCGMCQVYDKHEHCPPWSVKGECKGANWTWMWDNCPMSCGIPLSKVQFCAELKDGNYPISGICGGFVSCSEGLAHHMKCPPGTAFNRLKKVCDSTLKCLQEKETALKKTRITG